MGSRSRRPRADLPLSLALGLGVGLTAFVTVVPVVGLAYDNVSLHVALETAEGLIGALLAYLAAQRFRARHRVHDAVLGWTFAVLAVTNLSLSVVPAVATGARPQGSLVWLVMALRVTAAAGLCLAAFVDPAAESSAADARHWSVVATGAVVALAGTGALAADAWLGDAVDPSLSPEATGRPRIVGHPLVLAAQVVAMLLFAAAAVGFRRHARRRGDELLRWLAAGAVLSAFARLNFFLFPSIYTDWVYTGDVLRLASYLCFLVGAGREIDAYRRDQTRLAVLEERRRVARDLHDGLVQDLAFIRAQTASLAHGPLVPGLAEHVAAAADRALAESRRAVDALSTSMPGRLADVLRAAAGEIARPAGTAVEVAVDEDVPLADEVRHDLARIVREATSNAVRHGGARRVAVRVRSGDGTLRLTVTDDGKGFDLDQRSRPGFGLRSMRERAENLGGSFLVRSEPGEGSSVEVVLPLP